MGDPENEMTPASAGEETAGAPESGEPAAVPAEEGGAEVAPEPQPEPAPVGKEPYYGTGRRKTSVARVYLRSGSGRVRVNGRPLDEFFLRAHWREHAKAPLAAVGLAKQYDAEITVKGGGSGGQAGAVRQGLARALLAGHPALRPKLRQGGFLTRDQRMKERKKYGQKGARKRFQWTKR